MPDGAGAVPAVRTPQSLQSVPSPQMEYSELGPPSSHSLSLAVAQELLQRRTPQSLQSEPRSQMEYSELGPPSSHSLSLAVAQVFVHISCALSEAVAPSMSAEPAARPRRMRASFMGISSPEWPNVRRACVGIDACCCCPPHLGVSL